MEKALAKSDKEVLVEVVKLAQKQGMKGEKGGWKEFLSKHDRKLGASVSDPGRRPKDDLVSFFRSFTKKEDVKFFRRALKRYNNHRKVEQLVERASDAESPEQKLVRLTRKHPLYKLHYSFRSLDEDWTSTKLCKVSKLMSVRTLMAIDCEMVLCEDGTEAVAKICVVNRELEVVIDQVVHPNKAVSDYRTKITGMSEKDFEGVTTSLIEMQASLKKFLKNGTILVGHSLHNDLRALKLDHARVIDTSFIFRGGGEDAFQLLSLNNLCKYVLDYELRKEGAPHNCLEDARAAMKLVLAKLERGLDDTISIPNLEVTENELSKLLLHSVPVFVPSEELINIFPKGTTVEIQPESKGNGRKYSTLAVFKDPFEVEGIFQKLRGKQTKDTYGRPQKLVTINLSNGSNAALYVRKMGMEASLPLISSCKKRKSDLEEDASKKQKMADLDHCADHIKEVERLRQELRQREDEIFNLQKIVAALTRKHGL